MQLAGVLNRLTGSLEFAGEISPAAMVSRSSSFSSVPTNRLAAMNAVDYLGIFPEDF
jgi:hypothetical protein